MDELGKFAPFNSYDNETDGAIYSYYKYKLFIDYDKNKTVTKLRVKLACDEEYNWAWGEYHPLRSTWKNAQLRKGKKK